MVVDEGPGVSHLNEGVDEDLIEEEEEEERGRGQRGAAAKATPATGELSHSQYRTVSFMFVVSSVLFVYDLRQVSYCGWSRTLPSRAGP